MPTLGLPFRLPLELSAMIRDHLSPADVIRCAKVCRSWRASLLTEESVEAIISRYDTHAPDDAAQPTTLARIEAHDRGLPVSAVSLSVRSIPQLTGGFLMPQIAGHFLIQNETLIDLKDGRVRSFEHCFCMAVTATSFAYAVNLGDTLMYTEHIESGRIEEHRLPPIDLLVGYEDDFLAVSQVGNVYEFFGEENWTITAEGGKYAVLMEKGFVLLFVVNLSLHLYKVDSSGILQGKELFPTNEFGPVRVTRTGDGVLLQDGPESWLIDTETLLTRKVNMSPLDAVWRGLIYSKTDIVRVTDLKGKSKSKFWHGGCEKASRVIMNESYLVCWCEPDEEHECSEMAVFCFEEELR